MLNINTYKDLKDTVMNFLNRKDQATRDMVPMFINFAEKQFTRLVKLPYYEALVNFVIDQNFKYVVIPQDLLRVKHLMVNGTPYNIVDNETFFRMKSTNTPTRGGYEGIVNDVRNGIGNSDGLKVFTRIGEQYHFLPTPKEGDVVELVYSQDIPEMQFDDDQPYSLLIAPGVLLYLALQHASIWLRDPEQDAYWKQKATEEAMAVMAQLEEAEWDGSALIVPYFEE